MDTRPLIEELQRSLRDQLEQSDRWRTIPLEILQQRPTPKRWSALEVVEHMNLSSGHYLRRLEVLYRKANPGSPLAGTFTPGRWGELATKAMRPNAAGDISWKMRTLFLFEPRTARTKGMRALDEFQAMLKGFLALLDRAKERGLDVGKVTSTLGPVLRFKAGDAFRFPIAHQERHLLQVERTLREVLATRAGVRVQKTSVA